MELKLIIDQDGIYGSTDGSIYWPMSEQGLDSVANLILHKKLNKKRYMTKKDFILGLGKALFPKETVEYQGIKPYSRLIISDEGLAFEVQVQKNDKGCTVKLDTNEGRFEITDCEAVDRYITKVIPDQDLFNVYRENGNMTLVIEADDYPWTLASYCETAQSIAEADEVEEATRNCERAGSSEAYGNEVASCDSCEALRKANADKLRLQHELDEAKVEIARLRVQNGKADRRKDEPWMRKVEVPGGHGIAFGFSF